MDRPAHLVAVAAGHRHVDEQQVGVMLADQLQRLLAVACGDDRIAGGGQPRAHHRAYDPVVIGDENDGLLGVVSIVLL
jgi:hypothetical protein